MSKKIQIFHVSYAVGRTVPDSRRTLAAGISSTHVLDWRQRSGSFFRSWADLPAQVNGLIMHSTISVVLGEFADRRIIHYYVLVG